MARLTVGSLFSGIGAMDLGLERAGCDVIWQCEINDYCRRVLEKHWPGIPKHEDIRHLDGATLPVPDILAGGFPCQDVSHAGKGAGIDGERSGLWAHFARLVRELRPRYVLVENVPGLLGRGMGRVLGDLAAVGYDAEWSCISAADVGAPHERERVFIVAYPQMAHAASVGMEGNGAARFSLSQISVSKEISGRNSAGSGAAHWQVEPDLARLVHGTPSWVDRVKALGNAVIPQAVEAIGRHIVEEARNES